MMTFSTETLLQFKSPFRSLARAFFLSRNCWRQRARQFKAQLSHLRDELRQVSLELIRLRKQNLQLQQQLNKQANGQPATLPAWKNLLAHQYSAQMICLCCQLSLLIGFRAVPKVIACFAETFSLDIKIPSRDVVRNWSCRNGVAILGEACHSDDWIWMIDHSVQLGKMYVLVVLGIRQSQLPEGRALCRQDMTPLAVLPTTSRDKTEVGQQLATVAKDFGTPLAVLSDEASELAQGVISLKNLGFSGIHLNDTKHKIANLLKKRLRTDERWKAFTAKLGTVIASIQQTELDHLLPPRKKEKARFMNFGPLIDWANMVQYQLTRSDSPEHDRIVEKLGWIAEFQSDLVLWSEYRRLMGEALIAANEDGVFMGASELLRTRLGNCRVSDPLALDFADQVVSFCQANEDQLQLMKVPYTRLPCSTEVLESGFGSFKALQGEHGRGTFTSLLAVFASQFDHCTATKIRERFSRVTNKDLKAWYKQAGLTNSTQSRRTRAYAEARSSGTAFLTA